MQLKQQYLPKFIGLIELHRDSLKINPEMSPSNFSFFEQKPKYSIASFKKPTKRKKLNEFEINKKAEIMIEIIKENTIRTLTEEEINRLIIKSANSYHHFSKEEFSTSNFPLLSVRNLVKKNEFIKYPWISSDSIHSIYKNFASTTKNSKKHKPQAKTLSLDKTSFKNDFLSIKKPCYTEIKTKIFETKDNNLLHKDYDLTKKRGSLPNMIIVPTPSKSFVKNIVSRHAQGFKNTNNKDFFDHMFRMFLKNKALLDQKQTKQLFKSSTIYNQLPNDIMIDSQLPFNSPYFHSQNFDDKEYKILKIKDFVLKKSLMDLKMYKKLISLYYQENESTEESPSKYQLNQTKIPNLNIITLSPDYLKFPAQKKYLHEEVFILNIIEKVQIYGIKSLHQNEISLFQAILNQREIQIDQLSTELFESFQKISRSDKKYATLIAESSDSFRIDLLDSKKTTSEFQKSSAKLSCSSPKKTYSLGVLNPIVFQTTEENETIHKKKGKVGELIKKKEKLKPLTMISSEKNGDETSNILFGNMELVELNYRLEAAKKELVQRLDLIHIKEDLIEFKGESLWNIQANKTKNELSINMSKETKEKESEQKIQKTNLNSETPLKNPPEIKYSGMDFSSSDRKVLKEKTFLLKQNSTFNNLENLITEEAHPKFSGKGSVAKLHKFSEIKNKNQTEKSSLFKTGNILTSKIKIYKNEPLISNEKVKVLKELETPKIEKKMDKLKEIQEIMKENDIIILENLKRKQPVAEIIIEKKQDIVKSDQTQKILSILKDSSPKLQTLTKKKSSNHLLFTENDKKNILSPEENNDLFLKHEETPSIQVLIETNKDTTNESSSRTLKNLMTQPKNTINKPKKSIKAKDSILNLNCDFKKEPKESILLDNTPIKIILRQTSPPEENKDQINTSISVDEKQTNKKNSKIHHSRIKNSSFSKIAVTQKNLKETEIEEIKQNLEENQQVKFVFNLLSEDRIKKNTIESEFQQDNIFLKPENLEEDLDKLLMGDMASLDKRAMRLSQIINKNILNSTNHQNSIDSLSLPNADDSSSLAKNPSKNQLQQNNSKESSNYSSKKPSMVMMEIKSINNLSSDKMSIEDEELKTGSWINDPIFENLNRKSLRLRGINDDLKLNSNNLAPNSKNSALNLKNLEIFLEENDKKNPINHIQKNNPTKLQSNYPIKKNTSPNVFVNSTNSLKVSNVLTTDIAERNNPNLNKNIMNQKIPDNSREELPLLRKKKKNEKDENPYSKLQSIKGDNILHLHKYIPSTNPSRSSESSFSNDLGLAELIDHELKKTEKIKLGDLKQSIEENIIKINEDKEIDNDAKFNIMLYENRKEQLQKYVELANDTNQNWLMQPNCIDQLRNFLNEKNKYLNDYEKNSSLKFCSPIHIPKNDAIKSINEFSKKNSVINTTDHEKFIEYIIKRSGERINEKERKKKFKVEEEMMKVLKKYLKSCRSSVKQSSLKQKNAQKIVDFQIISSVDMIVKKKQIQNYETNKSSKVEHHISRSKDDEKLINIAAKLKKLKEVNVQKFNEVLKKFQSIKIHQNAYYY